MQQKTKYLILCSMFASLTAILSQISIPLPFTPVPMNLATFSVLISGSLLGARKGFLCQVVYIILGAIGLPVFHSLSGGFGILAGPTGGYIIGYALAAYIVGLISPKGNSFFHLSLAMIAGITVCYVLGTIWFMVLTGLPLWVSFMKCVFPFLIGDAIKIFAAVILTKKLRNFI